MRSVVTLKRVTATEQGAVERRPLFCVRSTVKGVSAETAG